MQIYNKTEDLILIRFPIIFPLIYLFILKFFPSYENYLIIFVLFVLAEPHFAATWPIFLDKQNTGDVVLIDASKLGEKIKEGKNQKTILRSTEEDQIIDTFIHKRAVEDFSIVVSYDEIENKNHSLSAGQYFDIKIEYVDITHEEFTKKLKGFEDELTSLFKESHVLEDEIQCNLKGLGYERR